MPNEYFLDDFLSMVKEAAKTATPKPRTEFFRSPELKEKQVKELELWHHWNNNERHSTHIMPLLTSFSGLINKKTRELNRVSIHSSAVEAEVKKQFVNAIKSYNPDKGQLNTWITHQLNASNRFVKQRQNYGLIPEQQQKKIRAYYQAVEHLNNKYGYTPDIDTIADHMKEPVKKVKQLQKELKKDIFSSEFADDPAVFAVPKNLEALHYVQKSPALSVEDRTVLEHLFGLNGKKTLKPKQIADRMKISPSKVSRIKDRLSGFMQEAIEALS